MPAVLAPATMPAPAQPQAAPPPARRERVLAAARAKDIKKYTERTGREPRSPLLPRLVID